MECSHIDDVAEPKHNISSVSRTVKDDVKEADIVNSSGRWIECKSGDKLEDAKVDECK